MSDGHIQYDTIEMMKIKYTLSILLGIFLLQTQASQAASLEYSSVIRTDDAAGTALVRFGSLENKSYFTCTLSNLSCLNVGTSLPPLISSTPSTDTTLNPQAPTSSPFDVITDTARVSRRGVSPDGRFVFYYQYSTPTNPSRHFVLIDNTTGKQYSTKSNVHYWDLLTEENRIFSVSPDSKTLVYLDDREGTPALYKVNLGKVSKTMMAGSRITKTTYTVSDFMLYDANTLFFTANRENKEMWNLYSYNLKTQLLTNIASDVSYAEPMKKAGDNIIFLQIKGNAVVPAIYNPATKKTSYFNLPETPGIESISNSYQIVNYNGISGVLLKPLPSTLSQGLARSGQAGQATSSPLIIWLHGGPYRQVAPTIHSYLSYGVYDWALEEARRNGAYVLKIDYHGSYAHGRPFAESLKEAAGVKDVADVVNSLSGLKAQLGPKVKFSGTYLVGNSYGGYLALKSLVAKPNLFTGAYSINGVTDWPTLLNKLRTSIFNIYFDGLPTLKNSKYYAQADIVDHLNVLTSKNKMMLVQAQADMTIDPHQANFFNEVAASKGKNVDTLLIDGEDHVFHKASSITAICSSLLQFIGLTPNTPERCQYQ
jgi:dipeptidyl aminopeptidase/acylaminoacyl peptidase